MISTAMPAATGMPRLPLANASASSALAPMSARGSRRSMSRKPPSPAAIGIRNWTSKGHRMISQAVPRNRITTAAARAPSGPTRRRAYTKSSHTQTRWSPMVSARKAQ